MFEIFEYGYIHLRYGSLATAANCHRDHFFDLCATLNAFPHDGRTIFTRDHVTARFEENTGTFVRTHQTLVNFLPRQNGFTADQTFFDARRTRFTATDMTAWLKCIVIESLLSLYGKAFCGIFTLP